MKHYCFITPWLADAGGLLAAHTTQLLLLGQEITHNLLEHANCVVLILQYFLSVYHFTVFI